jgi:hypothetical protein
MIENETVSKKRPRRKLSEETKAKIAAGNTGKVFSAERRANIGKSRLVVPSEELLTNLQEQWAKRYVPAKWIMEKLNLSSRVYLRLQKEHCQVEQIKFLPQELHPDVFETIIQMCLDRIPCVDMAEFLNLEIRQARLIVTKLAPFYGIEIVLRPHYSPSGEHLRKMLEGSLRHRKENPIPMWGENNPNWKGGISPIAESIRKSTLYDEWRMKVLRRDRFQCVFCSTKRPLHVDHIYPFVLLLVDSKITDASQAPGYAPFWEVSNGRTLCVECHKKTETFGKQRNKYANEQF